MKTRAGWLSLATLSLLVACGSDDPPPSGDDTAYTSDPDKTVVVGGSSGPGTAQASASGCVTLPSGECVEAKSCGPNERRDVVLDSAGKVVAVVCYPADATPPEIDADGNVKLGQTDNGGVVALDGLDDGVDIAGDVEARGNNIVVYGSGPEVSVIGGNVDASGNNFAMRGVTVKGNVTVSGGNNATLVLCVIEGDLVIRGNNNVVADCVVKGKIDIDGSNNVLVSNKVGGTITVSDAKNLVCDANLVWADGNENGILDPGEASAPLECKTP